MIPVRFLQLCLCLLLKSDILLTSESLRTHNNNIKTGNGSAGCVHTVFKQSLRGDLFKWFTNIKVLYLVHTEERGDSRTVTILRSDTERNSFMLKPKCVSSPDGFPQRLNAVNVQLCCPAEFSGTDQPLIFIDE